MAISWILRTNNCPCVQDLNSFKIQSIRAGQMLNVLHFNDNCMQTSCHKKKANAQQTAGFLFSFSNDITAKTLNHLFYHK